LIDLEQWGFLNQWVETFPGTFSTSLSEALAFALFVTAMLGVAFKFLRRPEK